MLDNICTRIILGARLTDKAVLVLLTAAQMTTNLQILLRATGMTDKRYTMHSFRVGGAASHNMDGLAIGVLMEYVG